MTAATTGMITEPGVYQMTDEAYHADPVAGGSLSSSGARALLPPSCPALFRHQQDHGQEHKRVWDIGHAAHQRVLGVGPTLAVIDADDWRTKAAKAERDAARERGEVPILRAEFEQVEAMATALRRHPVAGPLFDRARGGRPEQTLIWRDSPSGVMCRARLDRLPDPLPGVRLVVPDYKTAAKADRESLSRAAYSYGYHQQGDWYLAGLRALGLADPHAAFVFACQEKTPPYLVSVIQLDHVAMRIGAARNRRAIDVYVHCRDRGHWPAHVEGVGEVSLPRWAEIEEGEHVS